MITVQEFTAYVDSFESDATKIALLQTYIDAAKTAVTDYIGYDPTLQTYIDTFTGNGSKEIQLNARPVTSIISVTKDGSELSVGGFRMKSKGSERLVWGGMFESGSEVVVEYAAGYAAIPGALRLAVLRIAALMYSEAGGNIGITSKSFQDQSRTFTNFTNYSKYLTPLDGYRIMRL